MKRCFRNVNLKIRLWLWRSLLKTLPLMEIQTLKKLALKKVNLWWPRRWSFISQELDCDVINLWKVKSEGRKPLRSGVWRKGNLQSRSSSTKVTLTDSGPFWSLEELRKYLSQGCLSFNRSFLLEKGVCLICLIKYKD